MFSDKKVVILGEFYLESDAFGQKLEFTPYE